MSSLLIGSTAREARVPPAAGPSWPARLARAVVDGWRVRRVQAEMLALDDLVLGDMGLGRCGIEHAVRFGRDVQNRERNLMQYPMKFLAAGVLALSVGSLSTGAQAAAAGPTTGKQTHQPVAGATTRVEKLVTSRVQFGSDTAALASGFQAIVAPTTVVCPAAQCAIRAEQNVEVQGTTASNRWAICTKVDGVLINQPPCPYLGLIPSDNTLVTGSFAQNTTVRQGTHTVQTFLFTDLGADRLYFEIQYQVYQ